MADADAGWEALAHIDQALAERPKRDGKTLKSAIQAVGRYRDHVVVLHRAEGGTRRRSGLEHINAVLSVVMAAEFPIGEVPWGELEKARGWLDALLREEAVQ